MPSIFARYVFRQAAGALLLILLSLGGVVWIALALSELNVVTSKGQDAWTLLKMTTLALPNLLAIIAPFALLVAVTHTLNRLNGDSELIVYTASGATIWAVARPLIVLALLVAMAVSYVNHIAMPWSLRLLNETIVKVRADLLGQVIQPGRFSSPEPGLTFHIRERTQGGELLGLVMHDQRNPKQPMSYLAERGIIVRQDPKAYLVMSNGHIISADEPKADAKEEPPRLIAFEKYAVDLDRFERQTEGPADLKPRERYLSELMNPEPSSESFKRQPGRFRSELHERFASPLYPLAFVLMALAAAGEPQSTRQNRTQRLAGAFAAAVTLRLGGLAVNNLAAIHAGAVPFLYAVPALACVAAFIAMRLSAWKRGGPSATERVMAVLEPHLEPLMQRFGVWRRTART